MCGLEGGKDTFAAGGKKLTAQTAELGRALHEVCSRYMPVLRPCSWRRVITRSRSASARPGGRSKILRLRRRLEIRDRQAIELAWRGVWLALSRASMSWIIGASMADQECVDST